MLANKMIMSQFTSALLTETQKQKQCIGVAAKIYSWTSACKYHVHKLLVEENMSSETSATESDTDEQSFKEKPTKYTKTKLLL